MLCANLLSLFTDHLTAVVKQVYEENKQLKSTVHKIELENKRLQNGYRKIVDTNNELRAEVHNIKGCCSHEQQRDNSLTSFKRFLLNNGKTITLWKIHERYMSSNVIK